MVIRFGWESTLAAFNALMIVSGDLRRCLSVVFFPIRVVHFREMGRGMAATVVREVSITGQGRTEDVFADEDSKRQLQKPH